MKTYEKVITEIYEPREDSFLLAEEVKKYAKGKVLDMCTGTGIQAITAAKMPNVKSVAAVDINKKAVEYAKKHSSHKKIKYFVSDLFSRVTGVFDTIICNPPYLPFPTDRKNLEFALDIALDGGEKGYELTEKFLGNAGKYLKPNGIILLLFSTLTKKDVIEKLIEKNCFDFEKISEQNFDFEKIFVYKLFYPEQIRLLLGKGIKNIELFAKGHRGIILTGNYKNKKAAVKIQRKDIDASGTVNNEALKLKLLNKYKIGPRLLLSGNDFFIYEFVEGKFIMEFIEKSQKNKIRKIIADVLLQMKKMDELGLNKEEMHHPLKHIIINIFNKKEKAVLIDFERCRHSIKVHNVTQFCEFIARISSILSEKGININAEKIRKLAEEYKKDRKKFSKIMDIV